MRSGHPNPEAVRVLNTYKETLGACPLFDGIDETEMLPLLACVAPHVRRFDRNELLLMPGQPVRSIGIVLAGEVEVAREDAAGNRHIIGRILPAGLYAETLVCAGVDTSPVTVAGITSGSVLLIDFSRLVDPCENACAYHRSLISNMLRILGQKNLLLSDKLTYLSRRSIRAKISSYLLACMQEADAEVFDVPFDRNGLAEYLSCDRSALSRELSHMKQEGILSYRKNRFTILDARSLADSQD